MVLSPFLHTSAGSRGAGTAKKSRADVKLKTALSNPKKEEVAASYGLILVGN
jgi:hypothetical protein